MSQINYKLLHDIFLESGLTYGELAHEVGGSRNTMSNIMCGRTDPTHYMASSISRVLDVTVEDLCLIFFPHIKIDEEEKMEEQEKFIVREEDAELCQDNFDKLKIEE